MQLRAVADAAMLQLPQVAVVVAMQMALTALVEQTVPVALVACKRPLLAVEPTNNSSGLSTIWTTVDNPE